MNMKRELERLTQLLSSVHDNIAMLDKMYTNSKTIDYTHAPLPLSNRNSHDGCDDDLDQRTPAPLSHRQRAAIHMADPG